MHLRLTHPLGTFGSLKRLQVAVCAGFFLPLFVAYIVEARAKHRFALRLHLAGENGLLFVGNVGLLPHPGDFITSSVLLLMCNIFVVAAVIHSSAGSTAPALSSPNAATYHHHTFII